MTALLVLSLASDRKMYKNSKNNRTWARDRPISWRSSRCPPNASALEGILNLTYPELNLSECVALRWMIEAKYSSELAMHWAHSIGPNEEIKYVLGRDHKEYLIFLGVYSRNIPVKKKLIKFVRTPQKQQKPKRKRS